MPTYFFDFSTPQESWADSEGSELSDLETARHQAVRTLSEIAKDAVDGDSDMILRVLVRDEEGVSLFEGTLTLAGRWLN